MSQQKDQGIGRANTADEGILALTQTQNESNSPAGLLPSSESKLPKATHKGELNLAGARIPCYVLEDGRRVLAGRAVTNSMGLTSRDKGVGRFLTKAWRPYMGDKLVAAIENPIDFFVKKGMIPPQGYEAWILPELCNAVIDAGEAKLLQPSQDKILLQAKILTRAFSTVGIIALVDEATGYQEVRDRQALQEILQRYISDELVAWALHFRQEFYREIFRLRGWEWSKLSTKRPLLVGRITNDIVYERLAPGVLDELRRKTPRNEKGRLKNRLFQWLTTDIGDPALERHLHAVTSLMKASTSWSQFYRMLQRALPKCSETGILIDVDD